MALRGCYLRLLGSIMVTLAGTPSMIQYTQCDPYVYD